MLGSLQERSPKACEAKPRSFLPLNTSMWNIMLRSIATILLPWGGPLTSPYYSGYLPWNLSTCVIIYPCFSRLFHLGILSLTNWKHPTWYGPWSPEHWGESSGIPSTLVTPDIVWGSMVPSAKIALLSQKRQDWGGKEICLRLPFHSLMFSVPGVPRNHSPLTVCGCL